MGKAAPPRSCRVYTPDSVATAVVSAMGSNGADTWLEPSVGNGAFLRALAELGVSRQRITAVDLDKTPQPSDKLARTVRGVDFLAWRHSIDRKFDKIVGNPPFVALSKLPVSLRRRAQQVDRLDGKPVGLDSNYWFAFLCASLSVLKDGGALGFVLPASWEYADYSRHARETLTEHFSEVEVHRCQKPLFDSVQEGSVVLLCREYGGKDGKTTRYQHSTAFRLCHSLSNGPGKTTKSIGRSPSRKQKTESERLGDVLEIRLGGVTGDAGYFLLDEDRRRDLGLPVESVRPVVTRARQLFKAEITTDDWRALRDDGERVLLFDPPRRLLDHPMVKEYLELPKSKGGCRKDGYKIRNRDPWYRTPLPSRIDGFMSGMASAGPWICLRRMARLNATNTLYTVRFFATFSPSEKYAWALSLLTSSTRAVLQLVARKYADGLHKFEPGDLSNLQVPKPPRSKGARSTYRKAIATLLGGDEKRCQQLADKWFSVR